MFTPIKALLAPAAVAAMSLVAASPALAADGYGHGRDYGQNRGLGHRDNSRAAVAACSRIAERSALRSGYDRANVLAIRDVRNTRWGYEVRGRLNVRERAGWRDNNWRDARHGWNGREGTRDRGSFSCRFERGRVVALDIDGIRGL
jgi:hypothetical protein